MTIEEIQKYITLEWVSEDFLSGDLKPSNLQQSSVYTDPLFTFQEKFLEKRWQRLVVRELLNEKLLPQNSVKPGTFTLDLSTLSSHHLNILSDVIQKKLYEAVEDVRIAVDQYYQHTLAHPSHQSKQFAKDLIEHFGGFADSNNLPYTTANTASSHCEEHQECVQDLIQGLQPISKAVNKYIKATYPALYSKMKKLDLGSNDHRNTLCVVCPLGKFEGGELTFPELKLIIYAKQGQAVAFRSNILVHGNLPVIAGVRHSVVFYIHNTIIKQKRKFGSFFADYELDWGVNSDGDEPSPKYLPPTLGSRDNVAKPKNHRRTNI
ncbi:11944_t:CDS:2, partial [Acaulospora colombiana]